MRNATTFAELEALACLGLAGFLALHYASVAGHKAFGAESRLYFRIVLYKCAGYGKTKSFGLAFVAAAVKIHFDVEATLGVKCLQRLFYYILKNGRREINIKRAFVDGDVARSFSEVNPCYRSFTTAYGIDYFHLLFQFIDVDRFGIHVLVGMLSAVVDVKIVELLCAKFGLGQHSLYHLDKQGVLAGFDGLFERFGHEVCRGVNTLATGITGEAQILALVHLIAAHLHLLGIDDDDVVAAIHIGREVGLVFAAQYFCHFCAQTTQNLIRCVDDYPLLLDGLRSSVLRFVT